MVSVGEPDGDVAVDLARTEAFAAIDADGVAGRRRADVFTDVLSKPLGARSGQGEGEVMRTS
jgi:hypothetical protein